MELMKASNQWANRPADERFATLEALHAAAAEFKRVAVEAPRVDVGTLRAQASDGEVLIVGKAGQPSRLSNLAFGQLSQRIGAPASYLRSLPPTLAVQNLNHGLAHRGAEGEPIAMLLARNGALLTRAVTGCGYARVWNSDVTSRLLQLDPEVWGVPPAMGEHPSGLYMGDRDLFAFLVSDNRVTARGCPEGLRRGFFVWNSEVGHTSLGIETFLFDAVCGNHIVWGARNVKTIRLRHVGSVAERFGGWEVQIRAWAESDTSEDEATIAAAQARRIPGTKEEVLNSLFRALDVPRGTIADAMEIAERTPRYGDPRTAWAIAQGLTQTAQLTPFAEERVKIDRAAGRVLTMAF